MIRYRWRNWRLSILRRQLENLELHSLHYPVRDLTWWNLLGMAERVRRRIVELETVEA